MPRVRPVTHHDADREREMPLVFGDGALNVWKTIGANPPVKDAMASCVDALWRHSGLTDRRREITILTVAAESRSAYVWHQHVELATAEDLLSIEEIRALARDDRASLSLDEAALVAYTRAVVRSRVTDAVHGAVAAHFDDATVAGITSLTAAYGAICIVIDALDVQLEPGAAFVGWEPR